MPAGVVVPPGDQRDARKGDHRVAPPVGEPMIPGHDGAQLCSPAHEKLVRSQTQVPMEGTVGNVGDERPAPRGLPCQQNVSVHRIPLDCRHQRHVVART